MKRTLKQRATVLPAVAASLAIGILIGWLLRSWGPPRPVVLDADPTQPEIAAPAISSTGLTKTSGAREVAATTGEPLVAPASPTSLPIAGAIDALRGRDLRLPIDGANVDAMKDSFEERRDGRMHEAVDILAPRDTPIHAVEDGTIAKLFVSKAGGNTIYQFDPAGRFCYYYAHLERYAEGLRDGQRVSRGDVIGYVGTSGNAPANTPHLHFTIFELDAEKHWWKGRAIDPYLIFRP